jgi:hypothetical protein
MIRNRRGRYAVATSDVVDASQRLRAASRYMRELGHGALAESLDAVALQAEDLLDYIAAAREEQP